MISRVREIEPVFLYLGNRDLFFHLFLRDPQCNDDQYRSGDHVPLENLIPEKDRKDYGCGRVSGYDQARLCGINAL
jgi:hypothetical protein